MVAGMKMMFFTPAAAMSEKMALQASFVKWGSTRYISTAELLGCGCTPDQSPCVMSNWMTLASWNTFRSIIIPLARPATVTVIILSLIGGLRSFDLIWAMTRGGPGFTSDVIASVIYKQYQAGFYGLSTAGSVVLFLLVTVIVVPLTAWLNRGEVS